MKVVSYYTKGTSYELEVSAFLESAEKVGLDAEVVGVDLGDNWRKNTFYKPQCILDHLIDVPESGVPVLWVDIDGRFFKKPDDLPVCDLAYYHASTYEKDDWVGVRAATLLFYPTDKARQFLKNWIAVCDENSDRLRADQEAFFEVLQSSPELDVKPLPHRYCYISPIDPPCDDIAIRHYQASRIYAKNMHLDHGPDSATMAMITDLHREGMPLEVATKFVLQQIDAS